MSRSWHEEYWLPSTPLPDPRVTRAPLAPPPEPAPASWWEKLKRWWRS